MSNGQQIHPFTTEYGEGNKAMGSLEQEPMIPREAQPGYLEGYLDALARVLDVHERRRERSVEDLCMVLRLGVKTLVLSGEVVALPDDLRCYPSLVALLSQASSPSSMSEEKH